MYITHIIDYVALQYVSYYVCEQLFVWLLLTSPLPIIGLQQLPHAPHSITTEQSPLYAYISLLQGTKHSLVKFQIQERLYNGTYLPF